MILCALTFVTVALLPRDSEILKTFINQVNGRKKNCRFLAQFQKKPFSEAGHNRCDWLPSDDVETVRSKIPCSKPVFITGTGYSGTHFTASAFNILLNISASHEKSSSRSLVDVSWFARYDVEWLFGDVTATRRYHHAGNFFRPGHDPQPTSRECMYYTVLHQVRHPLKVMASILHHTSSFKHITRETINPNRQVWAHIIGRTPIPESAWYTENGRFLRGALERAMLHYITWNYMVEQAADARYRVEDFNAQLVCRLAAQQALGSCTPRLHHSSAEAVIALELRHFSHQGHKNPVTWEMLSRANKQLAEHIWTMAQRYGYSRLPQHKPTKPTTVVNSLGNIVELQQDALAELIAQAKKIQNDELLSLIMGGRNVDETGLQRYARANRIARKVVQEYLSRLNSDEL